MATKFAGNLFEKLAFESAVSEHPTCKTAQLALQDYLMEMGFTLMGAKQRVARVVREEVERRQFVRVKEIFEADPVLEREVVRSLLSRSDVPLQPRPTLRVVRTKLVPAYVSHPGHWVDGLGLEVAFALPENPTMEGYTWAFATAHFELSALHALCIIEEITGDRQDV